MKYAMIDIGSNSIKMLRFSSREDLEEPVYEVELPQIVKGQKKGILRKDSMERTLESLKRFLALCEQEQVYIYATQSLRGAVNRKEFVEMVKELGHPIAILTEEEESLLAFLSAGFAFQPPYTVVDIGGASTEIAWGDTKMKSFQSYPVGSLFLHENKQTLLPSIEHKASKLIAMGGTVLTICAMIFSMASFSREAFKGRVLSMEQMEKLYETVSKQSLEERKVWIGLDEKRRPIIDSGIKILLHVMKEVGAKEIFVSAYTGMDGYAIYKGLI